MFSSPVSARALCLYASLLTLSVPAGAADGEAIIQKGGANPAAMPCMSCHGVDGKGMAAGGFPRLAGLPEAYIAKQLADFKAGRRENPLMQPIAQALGDAEAAAVAKAYASQPKVSIKAGPVERPKEGSGAWLALRGAWERNIPECTLCHGPAGVGVGDVFPPLAGQSAEYIEAQLRAWRGTPAQLAGKKSKALAAVPATRRNDPNGLMQHIAADLSEAEIKAVSAYFAGLGESTEPFDESQHRLR
ncbi:c-type cytochrome [Zoogloea sp.]|uniref:c-type cytochrome n=1 Tax=Zoogloea sp. TaxID=49181 RepID=UPI002C48A4C2|nr:c-type cytochrome [Zoogloea sp.]HQA11210.1 c-type cytochrome [Zoogloea sp.]HQE40130.1 c-type cytochrome [Zoogloea sp.]